MDKYFSTISCITDYDTVRALAENLRNMESEQAANSYRDYNGKLPLCHARGLWFTLGDIKDRGGRAWLETNEVDAPLRASVTTVVTVYGDVETMTAFFLDVGAGETRDYLSSTLDQY